jgi:two-component system response regulator AlgR
MRVLVVDDEAPARERLTELVADLDDYRVVGTAADGREALEVTERTTPDVVLMDIRMPGMDGIEAAHHLASLDSPPAVIFVTAFDDYALEAFETAAVGYILKPVRRRRLQDSLRRAARPTRAQIAGISENMHRPRRRHIGVKVGAHLRLIPVEDVRYFRADQKYVSVRHTGGADLIDDALKSLEDEFERDFVRIHRNALVALRHITAVEKDASGQLQVVMRDCKRPLPVSRRHAAELRRRIKSS